MKRKTGYPTISYQRLEKARNAKGWNDSELAAACDLNKSIISRIKHGQTDTSIANIIRIADALEVSIDYLVCREEFVNSSLLDLDKIAR